MSDIKTAEGHVIGWIEGPDGTRVKVLDTHNTTTYSSADALAAAYAGHSEYMPSKIAFVYGANPSVTRATTWNEIVQSAGDDYKITDFSFAPSLTVADDSTTYRHNVVVFHGRTQGIPTGKSLYKACLLGKSLSGDNSAYNLLAVVDLGVTDDGTTTYREKLPDYEFSIDWAVTFN